MPENYRLIEEIKHMEEIKKKINALGETSLMAFISDPGVRVNGPPSKCPECLLNFILTPMNCSGCGNDYEGWSHIIRRDKVLQKQITTEYFICPACGGEVQDITFDFNSVDDWIVFACPECNQDLQIEPPPDYSTLWKNAILADNKPKAGLVHYVTDFNKDGMMVRYACGPIGKYSRGTLEPLYVSCLSCRKTQAFKSKAPPEDK